MSTTSGPGSVDLTPDPRISTLRPAWLTDDEQWQDQLQAMDLEDAMWIEHQWGLTGGAQPDVDTSWITAEMAGRGDLGVLVPVFIVLAFVATVVLAAIVGPR